MRRTNSKKRSARTRREPTVNLNFKVDRETKDRLDKLQTFTRAPSQTQVFRSALLLLEKYVDAKDNGGCLLIDDGKGGAPYRVEFL